MRDVRIPRSVLFMWAMVLTTVVGKMLRGRHVDAVMSLVELHGLIAREATKEDER